MYTTVLCIGVCQSLQSMENVVHTSCCTHSNRHINNQKSRYKLRAINLAKLHRLLVGHFMVFFVIQVMANVYTMYTMNQQLISLKECGMVIYWGQVQMRCQIGQLGELLFQVCSLANQVVHHSISIYKGLLRTSVLCDAGL